VLINLADCNTNMSVQAQLKAVTEFVTTESMPPIDIYW
jgi:hypothetical protein